jgi:hypothetical protein
VRGKFTTYAVIVLMLSSLASWGSMVRRAGSGWGSGNSWHSGSGYSGGGWASGGGGGHK